jgi:signal transduction histidine kinase/DNA-binding response OmpR family regulator
MTIRLVTVAIRAEQHVVDARQRARQVAGLLGFESQDQTRIATAVSEIARNAFRYAGGGEAEFSIDGERPPQLLTIRIQDRGQGIANLARVLRGDYRSATGMGLGILGARRLMDRFDIRTAPSGTTVVLQKMLPEHAGLFAAADARRLASALAAQGPSSPLEEVQQQNRELMRALEDVRERQDELLEVNRELEDTNRGVVALYAELEERADFLRRADETKSRFLSNMSHEFRTPLNSIRALTQMLLDRADGPLNAEQEVQLNFIRRAAQNLTELVDDLLDIAKIEAGKIEVRAAEFSISDLFSALRGMLRPLLVTDKVALRFDGNPALAPLYSDEAKVSQILRNLISNALKFTERGEIRVSAAADPGGERVVFAVSDTGIGIPPEYQESIFEEFTQVRNPLQARVKGTGLGLPLCRRLAGLLGGDIRVESTPGVGSTFTVTLPLRYQGEPQEPELPPEALEVDPGLLPVMVVEDELSEQLVYERILRNSRYAPVAARTLRHARQAFAAVKPAAIILDVQLGNDSTWKWLGELKSAGAQAPATIVVSNVDDARKSYALGADAYLPKPVTREALLGALDRLTRARVLLIDDDPASRYTMRRYFDQAPYEVLEAADALHGMEAVATRRPGLIVLDLNLPDRRGEDVLRELAANPETRGIPVIVATAESLTPERRLGLKDAAAVVSKGELNAKVWAEILQSVAHRPAST